jgi:hypothetical protein
MTLCVSHTIPKQSIPPESHHGCQEPESSGRNAQKGSNAETPPRLAVHPALIPEGVIGQEEEVQADARLSAGGNA